VDIISWIVLILCFIVVRHKIFNQYFVENKLSISKRFLISFACGLLTAFLVLFVGIIISFVDVIGEDEYFNKYSTILTLSGLGTKDIYMKIVSLMKRD